MSEPRAVVVRPGEGARVGNIEFLARTSDTPRFTLGLIDFAAGRQVDPHVHGDEDDSFFVLDGELVFMLPEGDVVAPAGTFVLVPPGIPHTFANRGDAVVRMLNVHAPAGFDLRLEAG